MSEQKEKAQPVAILEADMKGGGSVKWLSEEYFDPGTLLYAHPPTPSALLAAAERAVKELRAIASEIADDSLEAAANELEAALNVQKQLTNH